MTGNFDPNSKIETSNEVVLSVSEIFANIEEETVMVWDAWECAEADYESAYQQWYQRHVLGIS